jgi:hypothetical protein
MPDFQDLFYWLDLAVGFSGPVFAFFLLRMKIISGFSWRVFWVGAAIGLTWEIPIFVGSYETTALATIVAIRPYPLHYLTFMISHTLWDGGLFLIGYWLVLLLCREPQFKSFNVKELLVLLVWGQFQEFMVEMGSTANNAWTFIEYWWNPALFHWNGHPITLFAQLVWLYGPIAFYFILLKLKPKFQTS